MRWNFYPRPLRGGRPTQHQLFDILWAISIHALCEEGDRRTWAEGFKILPFLSTPSARRATSCCKFLRLWIFISIHALCEEGDTWTYITFSRQIISIHALCEEGDSCARRLCRRARYFYPRPLRGGRLHLDVICKSFFAFLSTPSARRATRNGHRHSQKLEISIHALCEEGDLQSSTSKTEILRFLSTPSARRATFLSVVLLYHNFYFYPRPLRGGRPSDTTTLTNRALFLSTPSARRATTSALPSPQKSGISIHALCEEGDTTDS